MDIASACLLCVLVTVVCMQFGKFDRKDCHQILPWRSYRVWGLIILDIAVLYFGWLGDLYTPVVIGELLGICLGYLQYNEDVIYIMPLNEDMSKGSIVPLVYYHNENGDLCQMHQGLKDCIAAKLGIFSPLDWGTWSPHDDTRDDNFETRSVFFDQISNGLLFVNAMDVIVLLSYDVDVVEYHTLRFGYVKDKNKVTGEVKRTPRYLLNGTTTSTKMCVCTTVTENRLSYLTHENLWLVAVKESQNLREELLRLKSEQQSNLYAQSSEVIKSIIDFDDGNTQTDKALAEYIHRQTDAEVQTDEEVGVE